MGTRKKKGISLKRPTPSLYLVPKKILAKVEILPLSWGKGARLSVQQTVNYFPRHTRSPENNKDGRVGKGCGNQALGGCRTLGIVTRNWQIEDRFSEI